MAMAAFSDSSAMPAGRSLRVIEGAAGSGGLRSPPHNVRAELGVLAAILSDNSVFEDVGEILAPEHFFDPVNARLYEIVARHLRAGQSLDATMLYQVLEAESLLASFGGLPYLMRVMAAVVGRQTAVAYAHAVHECWLRRRLIAFASEVADRAYGLGVGESDLGRVRQQIADAEESLWRIADSDFALGEQATSYRMHELMGKTLALVRQTIHSGAGGVPTGFTDYDRETGGFHCSDLMILAGRPGMGKTAFALSMTLNVARHLHRTNDPGCVVFFSMEMSAEQIGLRLLSAADPAECGAPSVGELRRGDVSADPARMEAISRELSLLPLIVDDCAVLSVTALASRARRLHRKSPIRLLVVDYLQLLQPPSGEAFGGNRVQEVASLTRHLKALAKDLNIPVLVLSQLSRACEVREDKRPQLSDLRDSGAIEQDADQVIFLYREAYYLAQRRPRESSFNSPERYQRALAEWQAKMDSVSRQADVIVAKNRHGRSGVVRIGFDPRRMRFGDLAAMVPSEECLGGRGVVGRNGHLMIHAATTVVARNDVEVAGSDSGLSVEDDVEALRRAWHEGE